MPGPTEQSLIWIAQLRDELTPKLQALREASVAAWEAVTASFQVGADQATVAEQAISESLGVARVALGEFAVAAVSSGSQVQVSLVSSVEELLTRVGAMQRLRLPVEQIQEAVEAFLAARRGAADLGERFARLASESPEQMLRVAAAIQNLFRAEIPERLKEVLTRGLKEVDLTAVKLPEVTAGVDVSGVAAQLSGVSASLLASVVEGIRELPAAVGTAVKSAVGDVGGLKGLGFTTEGLSGLITGAITASTTGASLRDVLLGALGGLKEASLEAAEDAGRAAGEAAGEEISKATEGAGRVAVEVAGEPVPREARGLLDTLWESLSSGIQGLGRAMEPLTDSVVRAGRAMRGTAGAMLSAINPTQLLIRLVREVLGPIIEMTMDLFEALIAPLQALSAELSTALVPLFDLFTPIIEALVRMLTPVVEALVPALTTILETLVEALGPLMGVIGDLMEALGKNLATVIRMLAPIIIIVVKALTPLLNLLVFVVKGVDLLVNALQPLGEWLTSVAEGAQAAFNAIIKWLQKIPLIGWLFGGKEEVEARAEADIAEVAPIALGPAVVGERPVIPAEPQPEVSLGELPYLIERPTVAVAEPYAAPPRVAAGVEVPRRPSAAAPAVATTGWEPKEVDETAGALEKRSKEAWEQSEEQVEAMKRLELNPDDWVEAHPVIAKLARFEEHYG